MDSNILEIKDVCKRFTGANKNAVDHVTLSVERGDFVTILGTSGSGKTTLLKMVNRIEELSSGEILYKGQKIDTLNIDEYRRQIGYVIQQGGLFPHWTVGENISTVPKLLKWSGDEIETRVDELLKMIKLNPEVYRDRYPSKLSGGEQQRVGIARALAARPELMLMDEPFGALDAITRGRLQEELVKLQVKTGTTILFVTHDVSEALKLGNKVMVMDNGNVQQFDTPYQIIMHPVNDFVEKLVKTAGSFYDKLGVICAGEFVDDERYSAPFESEDSDRCFECNASEKMSTVFDMLTDEKYDSCRVLYEDRTVVGMITYHGILELVNSLR